MKAYCYYCDKENSYTVENNNICLNIQGKNIEYIAKIPKCTECGNEIDIAELDEENIRKANEEYRKQIGIIYCHY